MSYSLSHGKALDVGQYGLTQEDLPPFDHGALDLATWFTSDRVTQPLDLEIGSGKGTFLVQQAKEEPDVNYIGIEWSRPFWRYAADRCRRHGLDNVRLVRAEAATFVRHYVPDTSVRQVHIYFPDPWPKKRHHKRRLVQELLLRDLHRVLESRPGTRVFRGAGVFPGAGALPGAGVIRIATDHSDYFEWMIEHAHRVHDLFERLEFDRPASASLGELVGTNFERKYREEGRPFYAMILKKR